MFPRGQISATLKGSLTYFDGELNEGSESVDRVERHFASQIRGNELLPRLKIWKTFVWIILKMVITCSVTRWLDYFSIFAHLPQWKSAHLCHKFVRVGSAFCQIRNKLSKFSQRLVNQIFAKSGHTDHNIMVSDKLRFPKRITVHETINLALCNTFIFDPLFLNYHFLGLERDSKATTIGFFAANISRLFSWNIV